MTTYSGNNLHTALSNLSTNRMPVGVAEITEHDLGFVSGGTKTVKGDKIVIKSNGEIVCTGNCTVTLK